MPKKEVEYEPIGYALTKVKDVEGKIVLKEVPLKDMDGKVILRKVLYCRCCGVKLGMSGNRGLRLCIHCDWDLLRWEFANLKRLPYGLSKQRLATMFIKEGSTLRPKHIETTYTIKGEG